MIIITDSGSTKADWMVCPGEGEDFVLKTRGYNPFYFSAEEIKTDLLASDITTLDRKQVSHIFFYGSGCSDEQRNQILKQALEDIFPNSIVAVSHDLLAAARATCGQEPGVACILGTGSNSCAYDGQKITKNIPSLGFMVGDEGSGSYLGKHLVRGYFYEEMPPHIRDLFRKEYKNLNKSDFLTRVHGPNPNVYLASFSKFLSKNKQDPYIRQIVYKCFEDFFRSQVQKYKAYMQVPVHFVGSVAFHFEDILQQLAAEKHFKIGKILKKPIGNLAMFHKNQIKENYTI